MIRLRKESGYTLTELMIVIGIVGVLAFPGVKHVKTAAKLTGVQANYRSVITTIYGLQNTNEVVTELKSNFGDSGNPKVEDMTNPITNQMGVATSMPLSAEAVPAVYVLSETVTAIPSEIDHTDYKGAVVAIVRADNRVVVYGCDESGKMIRGLQRTIQL